MKKLLKKHQKFIIYKKNKIFIYYYLYSTNIINKNLLLLFLAIIFNL